MLGFYKYLLEYNIIKTEIKHLGDRRSDAVNNRRKIADQERKFSEAQEHIREIEAQMVLKTNLRIGLKTSRSLTR